MEVTCLIKKEGNQYASLCIELDVASCGKTKAEALEGLRNAIETYIEYMMDEKRTDKIYRPVPMKDLKSFLIGLRMEDDVIVLEKALHRKDIYRHFP